MVRSLEIGMVRNSGDTQDKQEISRTQERR